MNDVSILTLEEDVIEATEDATGIQSDNVNLPASKIPIFIDGAPDTITVDELRKHTGGAIDYRDTLPAAADAVLGATYGRNSDLTLWTREDTTIVTPASITSAVFSDYFVTYNNRGVHNADADVTSPVQNDIFFSLSRNSFRLYNGTTWTDRTIVQVTSTSHVGVGIGGVNPPVTIDTDAEVAAYFALNGFISSNTYLIYLSSTGTIREATGYTPSSSVDSSALVEVSEQSTSTSGTATDLSIGTRTATSVEVESSTGTSALIESATETAAGLASAVDKTKLGSLRLLTTGASVPASPASGDIHIYDAAASSLEDHRNNGDTADVTTASVGDHFKYDGTNWILEISASADSGSATTFIGLTDTPASLTEGRFLQVNSAGGLDEIDAAPVTTERTVLYEDTMPRTEGNATFFNITLSRAPLSGRLLDIEIFFDGTQPDSSEGDSPEDRYNTLIPMLLESDDFLSRPIHTSLNDPTGSIPFKTTRDVQNISTSAGFSHTTIYIAKAAADGSWMRIGSSHLGSLGSFVVRVVEYVQNAPVTDGTETDLEEGTRTATTVEVVSSSGTNATLNTVTTALAGVMTAEIFNRHESLARVTTGASVPSSPETDDIHIYDAAASSLEDHRNNNDTADVTTAVAGDHFKYNGTNWIHEVEPGNVAIISAGSVRDEHIAGNLTDDEQENFLEKIGGNQRYHHTVDRIYEDGLPRNSAQEVVITNDTGNFYHIYMGNYNSDLIENFLNSLGRRSEIVITNDDDDVSWKGYLDSIFDDDETSATLRFEFLPADRVGTFTNGEGITLSFGYSPINEVVDNETIERNEDGALSLKYDGLTKKGPLLATSSTLPTAATNVEIVLTWTVETDVPTGVEALSPNKLKVPEKRPYEWCDGLMIEALVDGTVISDSKVLWGPSGVADDATEAEQSVAVLLLQTSGGDRAKIDIYYVASPSDGTYLSVQGDDDILPSDTTVKIYLAR